MEKKRILFCEICPMTYAISLNKEIIKRNIRNILNGEHFSKKRSPQSMPAVIASYSGEMIKKGPGIDLQLQLNKAKNIEPACSKIDGVVIEPGESFSFWHYVGKTSHGNGLSEGILIVNGKLISGTGGGLCNLANTLNLSVMHSPLTITEIHHHSDALAPDPDNKYTPYGAGTSVNYNFIDYRFRNDTDQPVQLRTWCDGSILKAELRSVKEYPYSYRIVGEDHHFHKEENGKFYRKSKIYRETIDKATNKVISREQKWNNLPR